MSPERKTTLVEPDLKPLSARSLVASLLLRSRPPRMPGARLVQWCGLFGVAEGTARVALSRMVERGELYAHDGIYELAGRVAGRRPAQDWSIDPQLRAWKGMWRTGLVGGGARAADERGALRDAMRRLRYAELRDGVWTRPDNLPRAAGSTDWWRVADAQCQWWTGRPVGDPLALAGELFDRPGWDARARVLADRLQTASRALGSSDDSLADAFVVGASALAHLRADPLLPAELVRGRPQGERLRRAYRAYETAFSDALAAWFRRK